MTLNSKKLVILLLCVAGFFGCAKTKPPQPNASLPDLIPVSDPRPGVGFVLIESDPSGLTLLVTVKNQGTVDAPSSTTTVRFQGRDGFFPVEVPTFGLSAGTSNTLHVRFPQACFRPDCGFVIEVDSKKQVDESDENNNNGSGTVIG